MGLEQYDIAKRNLDAQSLGNVEEGAGCEECVIESCELVVSRRYSLREPVPSEVWKLDES